MKYLFAISFCLISILAVSQPSDSTRIDSVYNYQVKIPGWLKVFDKGPSTIFGGTFPAVNGIENAVSIRGYTKTEFKSFAEFKEVFLTGNKFGQPARFDEGQIWYGQNQLIEIENGVRQKVFIYWQNKIYHNQFVLLESSNAYILIQFVATPQTYDENISKFEEFMAGFTLK